MSAQCQASRATRAASLLTVTSIILLKPVAPKTCNEWCLEEQAGSGAWPGILYKDNKDVCKDDGLLGTGLCTAGYHNDEWTVCSKPGCSGNCAGLCLDAENGANLFDDYEQQTICFDDHSRYPGYNEDEDISTGKLFCCCEFKQNDPLMYLKGNAPYISCGSECKRLAAGSGSLKKGGQPLCLGQCANDCAGSGYCEAATASKYTDYVATDDCDTVKETQVCCCDYPTQTTVARLRLLKTSAQCQSWAESTVTTLGYVYKEKSCIQDCNLHLENYDVINQKTIPQCAAICESTPGCAGFEYYAAHGGTYTHTRWLPGTCSLQNCASTAAIDACDGTNMNTDLYVKASFLAGRRLDEVADCSSTDGTTTSSAYPCNCSTTICNTGEVCTSSTKSCEASFLAGRRLDEVADCSSTDGTTTSSAYPCNCSTTICNTGEVCTSSTKSCEATCATHICPVGQVLDPFATAIFPASHTNCCKEPFQNLTVLAAGTCESASRSCTACEGNCASDADCLSGTRCYVRVGDPRKVRVPGCEAKTTAEQDVNYCVQANALEDWFLPLPDTAITQCTPTSQCGPCQGNCNTDADCAGAMKCFTRKGGKDVPYCVSGGSGDVKGQNYCYEATDSPWTVKIPSNADFRNGACFAFDSASNHTVVSWTDATSPGSYKMVCLGEGQESFEFYNSKDCSGEVACFFLLTEAGATSLFNAQCTDVGGGVFAQAQFDMEDYGAWLGGFKSACTAADIDPSELLPFDSPQSLYINMINKFGGKISSALPLQASTTTLVILTALLAQGFHSS